MMEHVPVPFITALLPEIVQMLVLLDVKVTLKPELAEKLSGTIPFNANV